MKLVVLSDLHMTPPGEELAGLDPHGRLAAAIARINTTHADADLVVMAGDLTDLGRTAAYEALREAFAEVRPPWAVTLGNHDNRDVFTRVFGADHAGADGFIQSAHHLNGQVVLVLDTLQKGPSPSGWGAREGALCEQRLNWLRRELDRAGGAPVHLVMHHPVLQFSPTHDPFLLMAPERFLAMIDSYPDVRGVLAGHIHMTTTTLRRGVPFITLAGGHASSREEFGATPSRTKLSGPAQMAIILSDAHQTTVHFDNYVDDHMALTPV